MKNSLTAITLAILFALISSTEAVDLKPTSFDLDIQKVRYQYASQSNDANGDNVFLLDGSAEGSNGFESDFKQTKRRSPLKAFLFSLIVPGAGQLYNGNKLKAVIFFGTDVATWTLNRKWDREGKDQTDFYEEFNRTHWSRSDYEDVYLMGVYGVNDDDLAVQYQTEISHHLPDSETQQYFEMTGKYNQFAWGWDDAVLKDSTLQDYFPLDSTNAITGPSSAPYSANREFYEGLRDDANNTFSKANNMIAVALLNRVVSSLEAYLSARNHNKGVSDSFGEFSGVKVRPNIKSIYTSLDTPYLKLSLRF